MKRKQQGIIDLTVETDARDSSDLQIASKSLMERNGMGNCRKCTNGPWLNENHVEMIVAQSLNHTDLHLISRVDCICCPNTNDTMMCQACLKHCQPFEEPSDLSLVDRPLPPHCEAIHRFLLSHFLEACEVVWLRIFKSHSCSKIADCRILKSRKSEGTARKKPAKSSRSSKSGVGYGSDRNNGITPSVLKMNSDSDAHTDKTVTFLFNNIVACLPSMDASLERDVTEFDISPSRKFIRLIKSYRAWMWILERYLRNDSIAEWEQRSEVFLAVHRLVQALAHTSLFPLLNETLPDDENRSTPFVDLMKNLRVQAETLVMANSSSSLGLSIENTFKIIQRRVSDSEILIVTKPPEVDQYVMAMQNLNFAYIDMLNEPDFRYFFKKQLASTEKRIAKNTLHIAMEVASLPSALPVHGSSSIFVRVDENRNEVVKALITGPEGTPYQNGCFCFDILLPLQYPEKPPSVLFTTTDSCRVRFNPNLYNQGKVCLSLLGTWEGDSVAKWIPGRSTLLQVLISIQSMIFVENPYFNEPGYGPERPSMPQSLNYNKNIRRETARVAMLGILDNPPYPFEEVIKTHFKQKKDDIIAQLKEWNETTPNLTSVAGTLAGKLNSL